METNEMTPTKPIHEYREDVCPDTKVTLYRKYIWEPDECGTPEFWFKDFRRLADLFPYPEVFSKYRVGIESYDHKDLYHRFLDSDPSKPGDQKASGLTNDVYDRSAMLNYPDGYFSWPASKRFPTPDNPRPVGEYLDYAKLTFFHEFGHHVTQESGLLKRDNAINRLVKSVFMSLYDVDDRYDPEDLSERIAEAHIPCFGPNTFYDRYGDHVEIKWNLITFLRHMYWLCTKLKSQRVEILNARENYTAWRQREGFLWWEKSVWYKIDLGFNVKRYQNGGWVSVNNVNGVLV